MKKTCSKWDSNPYLQHQQLTMQTTQTKTITGHKSKETRYRTVKNFGSERVWRITTNSLSFFCQFPVFVT